MGFKCEMKYETFESSLGVERLLGLNENDINFPDSFPMNMGFADK